MSEELKNYSLVDHWPKGAGSPAQRALLAAGYTNLEQLRHVTAAELLELHGVGPKAIAILRKDLAARGLAFAGETS